MTPTAEAFEEYLDDKFYALASEHGWVLDSYDDTTIELMTLFFKMGYGQGLLDGQNKIWQ